MADNRTKRSATKSTAQPMAAKSDTQKWNIPPQQRPLSSSSSTTPSAPLISSKTSAAIDALFDSGYDSQTVSKSSIDFDADFDSKCVISDAKSTSSMSATTTTSVADIDRKSAEHKWSDSGVSIATDSGLNLDEEFADQSAYDGDDSAGGLVGRSGGAVSLREAFTPDQDGDTYLHLAIIQGLADVAYALIRMAPDPDFLDATNHLSQTPLHLAALTGQSHIVRRLVISGATVDLRDRHGNTALHIACAQSDYTAVCQLISPIRDRELHSAHVVNYPVDSQHLPVHYLELRNYEGETSLHLAAYHKNKNIIELLVKCGVDVNAQEGKSGKSVLHWSVETQNLDLIQFLVKTCKAAVNVRSYAGHTPLHYAWILSSIHSNNNKKLLAIIKYLRDCGAEPSIPPNIDSESDSQSDDD